MQGYELAFIVDADLSEDKREAIVAQVKQLLSSQKAEPGELETWGKRDFTFSIAGKNQGVYYLQYFHALPESIADIERRLKINTSLLRYLIVRQVKTKAKKVQRTPRASYAG